MKIVLESEHALRLIGDDEGFAFEARDGGLSPFHFLAASLATCTFSVLQGWALHARLDLEGLEIGVVWEIGEDPVRVTRMDMDIAWPRLPPERHAAAIRAAAQCTVHNTLAHGTDVATRMAEAAGHRQGDDGERAG